VVIDWNLIYKNGPAYVAFQECAGKKAAWLSEVQRVFPIGTEVQIGYSNTTHHVGKRGKVVGYDTGYDGEYPLISVEFSPPTRLNPVGARDGFYADEIAKPKGDG